MKYPDIDRYDESLDWDLMELNDKMNLEDEEIPYETEESEEEK